MNTFDSTDHVLASRPARSRFPETWRTRARRLRPAADRRKVWLVLAGVVALLASVSPAGAQLRFGVQGNYADDFDFGVGARVETSLASLAPENPLVGALRGFAAFDYFFPDCSGLTAVDFDCSYWELHGGAKLPLPISETLRTYAGAGLGIARYSISEEDLGGLVDASSTDLGLNLLGGVEFPLSGLSSFAEARIELGGGEQFVLSLGVLFGGAGVQ